MSLFFYPKWWDTWNRREEDGSSIAPSEKEDIPGLLHPA